MKFVTINASIPPMPKYITKYIVLRDKTCREVLGVARRNPGVFIAVFATKSVKECPDYNYLRRVAKHDPRYADVMQPLYVGNLKPVESTIEQIVASWFGACSEEVILAL